jgi:hypothetical protein
LILKISEKFDFKNQRKITTKITKNITFENQRKFTFEIYKSIKNQRKKVMKKSAKS